MYCNRGGRLQTGKKGRSAFPHLLLKQPCYLTVGTAHSMFVRLFAPPCLPALPTLWVHAGNERCTALLLSIVQILCGFCLHNVKH